MAAHLIRWLRRRAETSTLRLSTDLQTGGRIYPSYLFELWPLNKKHSHTRGYVNSSSGYSGSSREPLGLHPPYRYTVQKGVHGEWRALRNVTRSIGKRTIRLIRLRLIARRVCAIRTDVNSLVPVRIG